MVLHNILGGICGQNSGAISKCSTYGSINVDGVAEWKGDPYPRLGGICGRNDGNIELSFNKANLKMSTELLDPCVGGICSDIRLDGEISNCYNIGSLYINFDPISSQTCAELGGICGLISGDRIFYNCYTISNELLIESKGKPFRDRSRFVFAVVKSILLNHWIYQRIITYQMKNPTLHLESHLIAMTLQRNICLNQSLMLIIFYHN